MYQEKHSDALPIPNLEVMKLLQSFKSRGLVRETFNWQWYYYYLTDEGIAYLRQYLGLPEDIIPATLKVTASAARPQRERYEDDKGKGTGPGGDFKPKYEGEYRREYRKRTE
jgi:small subunit ribosomal protein S10e